MAADAQFEGLNLVAGDVDATLAFYRTLGIAIPEEIVWRSGGAAHHVDLERADGPSLDFDSEALAHAYNAGFDAAHAAGRTVLGFRVGTRDEVDETYAQLVAQGSPGVQEPYDAFWGARYAIVCDPDGRHVGIMSPRDPARSGAPPEL